MAGMAVGGWLGGAIFDATLSYRAAFQAALAFNLLNLMLLGMLLFARRRRIYASGVSPGAFGL
jgi:predicted MFS family arabinose efflux permease